MIRFRSWLADLLESLARRVEPKERITTTVAKLRAIKRLHYD